MALKVGSSGGLSWMTPGRAVQVQLLLLPSLLLPWRLGHTWGAERMGDSRQLSPSLTSDLAAIVVAGSQGPDFC